MRHSWIVSAFLFAVFVRFPVIGNEMLLSGSSASVRSLKVPGLTVQRLCRTYSVASEEIENGGRRTTRLYENSLRIWRENSLCR
jgi:hypothetical protein